MMVRNNEEIVGEVIEHLISQGLELVVLDNGSTDKTYEICEKHDAVNTHIKKLLKEDPSKKIAHQLLTKYMDDSKWNYKTKFTPYDTDTPPKRDEIFTKEGYLKVPQKTNLEYRLLLNEKQSTLLMKLLYRRYRSAKLAFSEKLNLFNNKNKNKL